MRAGVQRDLLDAEEAERVDQRAHDELARDQESDRREDADAGRA